MKFKSVFSAVAIACAVFSAQTASAEGFYVGADIGSSKTDSVSPGVTMTKSTDTVGGVLLGYQFTPNWGAEVFYTGLGKFSAVQTGGSGSGKGDAYGIEGVGTVPLSDAFSLFGRLGYASAKTKATTTAPADISATRNAATWGLGGQFNANQNIGIRLAYDRYGAATSTAGVKNNYNVNIWSLGLVYDFH